MPPLAAPCELHGDVDAEAEEHHQDRATFGTCEPSATSNRAFGRRARPDLVELISDDLESDEYENRHHRSAAGDHGQNAVPPVPVPVRTAVPDVLTAHAGLLRDWGV